VAVRAASISARNGRSRCNVGVVDDTDRRGDEREIKGETLLEVKLAMRENRI
jgi:hypothetical protein